MNINPKTAVTAVAGVAAVGVSAANYIRVRREEQAKRAQIEINKNLDMEAIRQASLVMRERMSNAEYYHSHTVVDMLTDLDQEIKFQQIAVRNKD